MSGMPCHIILASKSPRRRELFSLITTHYECIVSHVDEHRAQADDAKHLCLQLAQLKAAAVFSNHTNCVVIGCDTVVEVDGAILGKPKNKDEARSMLQLLSGRKHNVYTGVSILGPAGNKMFACRSTVTFCPLTPTEIENYISTEEPYDKAGGYGIQGRAATFIRGISGDYYNVMGLPVSRLYGALKKLHYI